ncbi:MAG: ABC transporter ATP-binding protein, partial [Clostridia bacterium]|nr:ABC transporter ATP-binding protein [Clostridia bacterium]
GELIMYCLEIKNLTVDFIRFKLDNICLNIKKGCITGLIGRNGAGKSTLIKTIMRQQDAQSGSILYNGMRFADAEESILKSIVCVYDTPDFDVRLKPKKFVKLYSAVYRDFDMEKYNSLMTKFSLPHDLRISKYSYGMQKKFCIILALCRNAEILILDEPTSGIDPFDRNEIVSLIQEYMTDENHTVIFSTHITEDLDKIADYIVMMDNGRITIDEEKDTLCDKFRLVQCEALTPEMEWGAIGVKKSMFGYTFLTKNLNLSGDGIKVKVPTLEEIFVHLLENGGKL